MSFTKQVITGTSAEGDYIYYNGTVVNATQRTTDNFQDPEIFFQDTRQNPLVKDSSKYVLSVDNFTLNGGQKTLPILIPQIESGTDINKTIYTISFGWTNTATAKYYVATIPLTWFPELQQNWLPVPTSAVRQQESEYYYCYSYSHWLNILNNALTAAWRDVQYRVTADGGSMGTQCPFFEYNSNTGLFSICQDANTSWVPYGTYPKASNSVSNAAQGVSDVVAPYAPFGISAATSVTIYTSGTSSTTYTYSAGEFSFVGMNTNLEGLMTNFDTVYFGDETVLDTAGKQYTATSSTVEAPSAATWTTGTVYWPENVINVIPQANLGDVFTLSPPYTPTATPTIYYIRETQDFISTGSLWSPIASLVLLTSSIPVRFEGNAAPVQLGSGNMGGSTASTGAAQKVLLETPINAVTADLWRGFIEYKPLVPLFSALDPVHDGIINLDVKLCWRNRFTNEIIPIRMYNSGNFNFRLRFVRKSS